MLILEHFSGLSGGTNLCYLCLLFLHRTLFGTDTILTFELYSDSPHGRSFRLKVLSSYLCSELVIIIRWWIGQFVRKLSPARDRDS